jgi:CheY-like chemotaxis protein
MRFGNLLAEIFGDLFTLDDKRKPTLAGSRIGAIDPDDLQRIFEPFFTKKIKGRSGTGLGMAVVHGTVQDHDGYIEVTSTPGKGTRFDRYFPVTDAPIGPEKMPAEISSLTGSGERILVVDDAEDQRKTAGDTLSRLDYTVNVVESGETAVAYLKERNFDLILLDMMMPPGIDGLETLRKIQAFKPDQKVVIASGFSKEPQVRSALKLGALQYVKSPTASEKCVKPPEMR